MTRDELMTRLSALPVLPSGLLRQVEELPPGGQVLILSVAAQLVADNNYTLGRQSILDEVTSCYHAAHLPVPQVLLFQGITVEVLE